MSLPNTHIVIMAGGQGTRFWPISRMEKPKQFLSVNAASGESLIQATARRVSDLSEYPALVVSNVLHEKLVRQHLPKADVLLEPIAKNTAASIGFAAIWLRKKYDDPVMVVLPADHAVANEQALRDTISDAVALASQHEVMVTIGVEPTYPNTGYGYIKRGVPLNGKGFMVRRFFEKPNQERAIEYCKSGDFFWNSGMFAWKASVILEAIEEYMPQLYEQLSIIEKNLDKPQAEQAKIIEQCFANMESTSIDFGVLELARNCAVVPGKDFGWNDVGSWDAWAEHFSKDQKNNLLHGDSIAIDSQNSVVFSTGRFIALVGVEDMVVIDSGDAVLVCPRSRVQEVKKVVDHLKSASRKELM
jgi:mannose-1-phosphate guanylyltransferase